MLNQATESLRSVGTSPWLDALVLLEALSKRDRGEILAALPDPVETILPPELESNYRKWIGDRAEGLPVAYITGRREFWGLSFRVGPGVLVPRPETEVLVEETLLLLKDLKGTQKMIRYHDCCTGSGCVALAVVRECLNRDIMIAPGISDIEEGALDWARRNIELLVPEPVPWEILQGRWLEPLAHPVDIITANPPYLTDRDAEDVLSRGWGEPVAALAGGDDGLAAYRTLIPQARRCLAPGGHLLLECGAGQAEDIMELCRKEGFSRVRTRRDYAGIERVVAAGDGSRDRNG